MRRLLDSIFRESVDVKAKGGKRLDLPLILCLPLGWPMPELSVAVYGCVEPRQIEVYQADPAKRLLFLKGPSPFSQGLFNRSLNGGIPLGSQLCGPYTVASATTDSAIVTTQCSGRCEKGRAADHTSPGNARNHLGLVSKVGRFALDCPVVVSEALSAPTCVVMKMAVARPVAVKADTIEAPLLLTRNQAGGCPQRVTALVTKILVASNRFSAPSASSAARRAATYVAGILKLAIAAATSMEAHSRNVSELPMRIKGSLERLVGMGLTPELVP